MYARVEAMLLPKFPSDYYWKGVIKFISGSMAGSVAVLLTYPFDVIRTRLAYQTTGKLYHGITHGFCTMLRNEGPLSLFKGISPTLLGVAIYGGTTFSIFFTLKNTFFDASKTEIFLFGSFAGLTGQIVSYPFDVVRKRMLAKGFIEKVSTFQSHVNGEHPTGVWSYLRMIYKYEGVRGLMKGVSLNFIKAPIMLGTVHLANHLIHKHLNEDY